MKSIVGDEKNSRFFSEESGNYAVIVEKMKDAKVFYQKLKASGKKVICHMVVDECQNLTTADYRDEAIKTTLEFEKMILADGGSVVYMSATIEAMVWVRVDKYLFFDYTVQKAPFEEINLIVNKSDRSFVDFIYDCLMVHKKGFVRINKKKIQKKLYELFTLAKLNVCKVCGDDKDYLNDENGKPVYINELLDSVIRNSCLPECDIALATSLLDAGENIHGIGKNMFQDPYFFAYFCIGCAFDTDMLAIQQYANRMRYPLKYYNILYYNPKLGEKSPIPFQTLEEKIAYVIREFKKDKAHFEEFVEFEKKYEISKDGYDEEVFEKRMNHYLAFDEFNDDKDLSYGGALEYKNGEVVVHENFLCNYALQLFYHQYYYDVDMLKEKLEATFGVKVNIIENTESYECPSGEFVDQTKKTLLDLLKDPGFILNWTDDKYKNVRQNPIFDDAMYLRELGMSFKEAIETECTVTDKELDKIKTDLVRKLVQTFKNEELSLLEDILCRKAKLSDCKKIKTRQRLGLVLRYDTYVKKLKKMLKVGIPIKTAIQVKNVNSEVGKYEIIETNKLYVKDRYSPFFKTSKHRLQRIILDYAVDDLKFHVEGKNRIKLTQERLDELGKRIYDLTGKGYKDEKLIEYIKQIFTCVNVLYNEEKVIELRSLKM